MTQTRQLFGTDGIRGVAGEFPLTRDSVYWIGRALGHDLMRVNPRARVVIGQDTRASSQWIADRFLQGLASVGVASRSAGVITTPGVAFLARSEKFDAGIVISASHNPWTDNGIKIFSGDGYKLPDARELAIEKEIFTLLQADASPAPDSTPQILSFPGEEGLRHAYVRWLADSVATDLSRLRVAVDCANGAATAEAPELFRALNIDATFLNSAPDGQNINENCGALHPETVANFVAARVAENKPRFDVGVTFDGDADRALFCDATGRVINGDAVLLVAARDMQSRGALAKDTVVATTMSNMGLELALKRSGIQMLRANVGDKYVLEEMQRVGATLGGEQSGHILFRDGEATTGDGLLTALRVLEIMVRTGNARTGIKPLADLVSDLKVFPQTIRNVRVRQKTPFEEIPSVQAAIAAAQSELDGIGRVVVRYSGTEALARVMIEAESQDQMDRLASSIVAAIRTSLGI
jgi:phosphoglucosamine mutase